MRVSHGMHRALEDSNPKLSSSSAMTDAGPVVQVKELTVVLGGRAVVAGVDLEVMRGTFLGIVGPNGGGKTTLLRTILGLVQPASGQVLLFWVRRRGQGVRGGGSGTFPSGAGWTGISR